MNNKRDPFEEYDQSQDAKKNAVGLFPHRISGENKILYLQELEYFTYNSSFRRRCFNMRK